MDALAHWQVSLTDAVNEVTNLVAHLQDAPNDSNARNRLARTATLIRSVAQVRGIEELLRLARTIGGLARQQYLGPESLIELQGSVEQLRSAVDGAIRP